MTTIPVESSPSSTSHGIDFNAALDILSQRTTAADNVENIVSDSDNNNVNGTTSSSQSRGCDCGQSIVSFDPNDLLPNNKQPQHPGQVIDIGSTILNTDSADKKITDAATDAKLQEKQIIQQQTQQRAVERQEQLLATIQSMSMKDIVSIIFHTQEERVRTYRFYDDGLDYVLSTGNIESYPLLCADVTATFTVLSSTINAIRTNLKERRNDQSNEMVVLINKLQQAEQTKLQVTAGLHLEQIRYKDLQEQQTEAKNIDDDGFDTNIKSVNDEDPKSATITSLLEESIKTLRKNITSSIDVINEALEELRFIDMEEE